MEMPLVSNVFLLSVVVILLLSLWSEVVKYYCKVGFILFWLGVTSIVTIILCAHRGRNADNVRIYTGVLKQMKHFLGVKIKVQGHENLPNEDCYVMVANHQGNLDFAVFPEFSPPRCVLIGKKEVMFMGPMGLAFWLCGFFFIDRQHRSRAINTMLDVQKEIVANKLPILICPEGTRNYSNSMLPFKHGAFHLAVQAQIPVVPVVISSYHNFFNKREKKFTKGECIVQILPKIETQGLNAENVPELTERIRDTMLNVFYRISEEVKQ